MIRINFDYIMIFGMVIMIFIFSKILFDRTNEYAFLREIYYLESIIKKNLNSKLEINNIDDLKKLISTSEKKEKDPKSLNLKINLDSFKNEKMNIYKKNTTLWIDYSNHKIENGKYILRVSEETCKQLTEMTVQNKVACINNKIDINLKKDNTNGTIK